MYVSHTEVFQIGQKWIKYSKLNVRRYVTDWSFMKVTSSRQKFVKNSYTEFHNNSRD